MEISRRALFTGVALAPFAASRPRVPRRRRAAFGPRVIGVSPQNSLGWIDAVTREPLPGPRWPLPGWWALAVSRDRQAVLLRHYASDPFVLATSDTTARS